jgi:hypothetical protein
MALSRINWASKPFALCAIAMTLAHHVRGLQRYDKRSPVGSAKNEWRLLPHCTQSDSISDSISQRAPYCCTDAESEIFVLCRFEIIKHEQNVVASWQFVHKRPHITQMTDFPILLIILTEWFETFMFKRRNYETVALCTVPLCAHTVFPFNLFVLCFSKHVWFLNVLLHASHGIRTSDTMHGGMDMQSVHASRHLCVTRSTTLATAITDVFLTHSTS